MRDFNSYNPEVMGHISYDTDTWLLSCAGLCDMNGVGTVIDGSHEPRRKHNSNFDERGRLKVRTISVKVRREVYGSVI